MTGDPVNPGRPAIQLFVDALAGSFKPLQNVINRFRPDHEFLEAFHSDLGHFCGSITVKELGYA